MDFKDIINRFQEKDDAAFKENCLAISKGIQQTKTTILNLIESLGPLLTDKSPFKRELATLILNEVLKNIPIDYLNGQQLGVITDFYSSKLKDHHQLLPAVLSGILILIRFENFPGEKVSLLLSTIFQNVPCQQQQRVDRYTIYQILDALLIFFKQEIQNMKLEFVYGVLQAVENERDPRNLLFLFKWMKEFLNVCLLQHLTEDMFDILACYFPVDFRAPTDENSISREDLADALLPCLCANPDFGDSCISLALEKLDSSLNIAKLDSLKLLKEGCSNFKSSVYIENFSKIWPVIQKEILSTTSDIIRSECLSTHQSVIAKISEESSLTTLKDMLDTLKGNLFPDSKLFKSTSQILICTATGSEKSCKCIIKEIVPTLTNIYKITTDINQKCTVLKTLVNLTKVHLQYNKSLEDEAVPDLLLIPFSCLELLNAEQNARKVGLECLAVFIPYLTLETRQKLYPCLQTIMFIPMDRETELYFTYCLKTTASHYPDEVKNNIFNMTPELSLWGPFLKSKAALITLKDLKDYVIEHYLDGIKKMEYSKITIQNTRYLVEEHRENSGLLKELIEKDVLKTIIEIVLSNNCTDIPLLEDISIIMTSLIAPQTLEFQKEILEKYYNSISERIAVNDLNFLLLFGLLAPLRKEIPLNPQVPRIAHNLVLQTTNEVVSNVAMQLLGNLVNKWENVKDLNEFLEYAYSQYESHLDVSKKQAKMAYFITKGLILRNHPEASKWMLLIVRLLERHPHAAEGIKIIMDEDYAAFSAEFHCRRAPLYKQKTFEFMVNKIVDDYTEDRKFLLSGLAYLCEHVPLEIVILKFQKITPLLIQCLEQNEAPDVILAVTTILKNVSTNFSAVLEKGFNEFFSRILKLTRYKMMKVRIECLKCIKLFPIIYSSHMILPHKSEVLKKLAFCVDDKKRLVRKEAMEARSLWCVLDDTYA